MGLTYINTLCGHHISACVVVGSGGCSSCLVTSGGIRNGC